MKLSIELMTKNKFKKENPLFYDSVCGICGFELGVKFKFTEQIQIKCHTMILL